jgi:hypothetical protein
MPSSEPLKMPERSWPTDALGNLIRKGQLCSFKAPQQQDIICRVVDVIQAGVMHGPDDKPIALQGSVTFAIQIPYSQGGGIPMALCLKEPEK